MALSFRDLSHLLMGTGLQWAGRDDSSLFARAEMALHTNSPVTSEENQTIGPVSVDGRRSAERRCQGRTKQDPCIGSKFRRGKKRKAGSVPTCTQSMVLVASGSKRPAGQRCAGRGCESTDTGIPGRARRPSHEYFSTADHSALLCGVAVI